MTPRRLRSACLAAGAASVLSLPGCKQDMYQQRKLGYDARTQIWENNTSARPLPAGVVAQSDLDRHRDAVSPPPVTAELLERGQERYGIYCTPCHGRAGEGDGMVVQRGFPPPPSYHTDRLRAAPARHFYDVISDGYGVMYSYAQRVAPRDRWAITAYIRALQTSRAVALAEVPDAREKLP